MSLAGFLTSQSKPHIQAQAERARVYVRVSHKRSAEKAISPETQRRRIEAYAREHNYNIFEWYSDLAKSAFHDETDRPEFLRMLADAKADPLTSVIIVFRYDRFSRSYTAPGQQYDLLRHGVRIESAEEGYYDPDSETGAIMMPLTWSLNRLFSLKLRNLVIPNMKVNFEQRDPATGWAYKNGGWAQFGYRSERIPLGRNSKGHDVYKMIWLHDDRVFGGKPVHEWVRTMLLEWRLGERVGYDTIAARLTQAGIPTPMGRTTWTNTTIQGLLGECDRIYQYAGFAFWNREDCHDRGNRKRRDTSEWIVVPQAHPAIITEEDANLLWEMVEANKRRVRGNRDGRVSPYALSGGLLRCAHCGANYAGATRKSNFYYVCGSHLYRRGEGCGPAWYIPRRDIEHLVLSKIFRQLDRDPESLAAWLDEVRIALIGEQKAFKDTATDRKRQLRKLEKQLSGYLDLVGLTDDPELPKRIANVSASLARLRRLEEAEFPTLPSVDSLIDLRKKAKSALRSNDPAVRIPLIHAFVVEITADAEKRAVEGVMHDPRSLVYRSLAAPTGDVVVRVIRAWKAWHATWLGRKFWAT